MIIIQVLESFFRLFILSALITGFCIALYVSYKVVTKNYTIKDILKHFISEKQIDSIMSLFGKPNKQMIQEYEQTIDSQKTTIEELEQKVIEFQQEMNKYKDIKEQQIELIDIEKEKKNNFYDIEIYKVELYIKLENKLKEETKQIEEMRIQKEQEIKEYDYNFAKRKEQMEQEYNDKKQELERELSQRTQELEEQFQQKVQELEIEFSEKRSKKKGEYNKINSEIISLQEQLSAINREIKKEYDERVQELENEFFEKQSEKQKEYDKIQSEIFSIRNEMVRLSDETIKRYYIFSDYDGITSQDCKNQLSILKAKEKDLRQQGNDVEILYYYEKKKIIERSIRQILRNFNSECDNIITNITIKNIDTVRNRIEKSYETLNKLYSEDGVSLTSDILSLKLEQATLLYTYELKCQQEKDIQRAIKEQMMEEARAEREIQEQKKKVEKDLQQHLGEINRLMKYMQKTQIDAERQLYMDKIQELEERIKELESDKETVLQREANAKAGFVYVISNIGSFGEGIYKIGMTRRLEPMERIRELSSASVPFEFDVHAMIFSSDAPELETTLHKHFADKAVNKVNPRKEFYRVDIDEIEKVVKENYNDTVQFTKIPIATEYRQSIEI